MLHAKVWDTGIGIREEQLSRLFQPFSQADASISRRYGGAGLGLSITPKLAQALGGEVRVESEFGAGSTFELVVPLRVTDAAATHSTTMSAASAAA